jgi:hypothetical protein
MKKIVVATAAFLEREAAAFLVAHELPVGASPAGCGSGSATGGSSEALGLNWPG